MGPGEFRGTVCGVNTDATFDVVYMFRGIPLVQHGVPVGHFVCEMSRIFEACTPSELSEVSMLASEEEARVCRARLADAVKSAAEDRVRAEVAEKARMDIRAVCADTESKLLSAESRVMMAEGEARYYHEIASDAVTRAEESDSHRVAACRVACKKANSANARAAYNSRMVEHAELKAESAQAEVRTCRELLNDAVTSAAEVNVRLEEAIVAKDIACRVAGKKASDAAKEADAHRAAAGVANKRANISEREAADAKMRAEEADTFRMVAERLALVATRDRRGAIREAERVVADAQNATRDAEKRAEKAETYRFFAERLAAAVISGHERMAEDAERRAEEAESRAAEAERRADDAERRAEDAERRAENADDEEEDEVGSGCLEFWFKMFG